MSSPCYLRYGIFIMAIIWFCTCVWYYKVAVNEYSPIRMMPLQHKPSPVREHNIMIKADLHRRRADLQCACDELGTRQNLRFNKNENCSAVTEQNTTIMEGKKDKNYKNVKLSHEMYVDDKYKMVYCPVPKVATSNWRRVLMVMGGRYNSTTNISDSTWGNYVKHFPRLSSFNSEEKERRLLTYTKVLFVRHPFERLLSAYRDKIERKTTRLGRRHGNINSFQSFVRFVIGHQASADVHWQTYEKLCKPCDVQYDIIGKYETLSRDANYVLQYIGADDVVTFPGWEPHGTNSSLSLLTNEYFSKVRKSEIEKLYAIYENDFKMFGYELY
ncbi:carbohydrate sulfotransferase 9-like [Saccoglossus kowalevskii]|uniref:Carbohydrate sulfotransferase n=1 Tax=Saccoglossus kowalevskii TaxID=10224 RepID=A0ABM0H033_SACKO|nr:PREDICTED: carbohydrate sulfotransferase 9-like [Saccoglossus kowalevskii]